MLTGQIGTSAQSSDLCLASKVSYHTDLRTDYSTYNFVCLSICYNSQLDESPMAPCNTLFYSHQVVEIESKTLNAITENKIHPLILIFLLQGELCTLKEENKYKMR